jgi:UDP:flavonoid glycosyltransferase YjiC (YdhE family)
MKYKVMILPVPLGGHMIAMFANLKQLTQNNMEVIVYSTEEYRSKIEQQSAEFRQLENIPSNHLELEKNASLDHYNINIAFIVEKQLQIVDANLIRIATDIVKEAPDLILYDDFAYYAYLIIRFLEQNEVSYIARILNLDIGELKLPKKVSYLNTYPLFAPTDYPNNCNAAWKIVMPKVSLMLHFKTAYYFSLVVLHLHRLWSKYNIKYIWPGTEFFQYKKVLIYNFPELQVDYDHFDKKFNKFVGPCINFDAGTKLNGLDTTYADESQLMELLEQNDQKGTKIIYVALGTMFNDRLEVFRRIIDALNTPVIQSDTLCIIATSKKILVELNSMIHNKTLEILDHIRLYSFVPQLKILERAKLFISHAGWNSVKEAVHFGVPIICLPISADHPMIAHHVTANLKLGIQLDINSFSRDDVIQGVKKIFADREYYERCAKYAEISRSYSSGENLFIREILAVLNAPLG